MLRLLLYQAQMRRIALLSLLLVVVFAGLGHTAGTFSDELIRIPVISSYHSGLSTSYQQTADISGLLDGREVSPNIALMESRQFYATHKTAVWTAASVFIILLSFLTLLSIYTLLRRRTEATLRESEEKLKSTLASMDDLVFVLDKDGIFESFYQPSDASGLYVSSEQFLGRSYREIMPPQVVKIFDDAIDKVSLTGAVERIYYELGILDERKCYSANISLRKNGAGRPAGFTIVSRDVTERIRTEESLRERQARLDSIIRVAPTGIGVVVDRVLTEVNDRICEMTGYPREELIGKSARMLYPTNEDFNFVGTEKYRQIYEEGVGAVETHWQKKDGTIIDIFLSSTAIVPGDLSAGVIFTALEISERKQAEESLLKSEAKYRTLTEKMNDMVWMADMDLKITYMSPSITKILGYTPQERLGHSVMETLTPESYAQALDLLSRERRREKEEGVDPERSVTVEMEYYHKNGSVIWLENVLSGVRDDTGRLIGIHGVSRDITGRRQAEDELQKSEAKYRFLTEKTNDMIWMTDLDFHVTYISPSIEKVLGFTIEERLRQDPKTMMTPESHEKAMNILMDELSHDQDEGVDPDRTIICEVENYHKNGSIVWTENVVSAIRDETGRITGLHGVSRDITERKRAEDELSKSEAKYRFLTEKMNDMIWTVDLNFKTTYVSPSIDKVLGFTVEERLRQEPLEMITPESYANVQAILRKELERDQAEGVDPDRTITFEVEFYHKNGSTVWTENVVSAIRNENGHIVGIHGVSRDISQSRRIEMQLRQAQKMEAMGTLAGGIAHDFNNILSAIIGYTELAQDYVTEGSKVQRNLDEVLKAGLRARDLVRQILTFSRQVEGERKPVQVHLIVKEALKLLRSSIPSTIKIREDIDTKSGMVIADPTQIHQVIMNLCTNAYQAMDDHGGLMHVVLEKVMVDSDFIKIHPQLQEGPYIRLSVNDTGEGIDSQTLERIFDPFFTTKSQGKGTGLGLATVHGIVTNLQGIIHVDSTVGQGSTFSVYLPCTEKGISDQKIMKEGFPHGQGERILLIDDETSIVQIEKQMLEDLGYIVTIKTDSIEALESFRMLPDQFDLVITDMTMPNLTGVDLSHRILEIRPDIPIILCTGFSDKINKERAQELGIQEYLEKPFDKAAFAWAINRALHKRSQV